jgi:uncharacterized glyoxalase superfamily protein PhnB
VSAAFFIDDVDTLFAEYKAKGVEFIGTRADMSWGSREFVIKDCDDRLLVFGSNL